MDTGDFEGWSKVYDIIYSGKKKEDDVNFYLDQAKKVDGPVLEIGCGTGRIYLELLKAGIDATGIDVSEGMLETLREKAEKEDLKTDVHQADMKSFNLGKNFDLIIIPFRTFLHNITLEEQIETLEVCRNHLKEDGKLVLNFFPPDCEYISENYGEEESEVVECNGDRYEVVKESEFVDEVEQVVKARQRVYHDEEKVWEGEFKLALISKRHFQLLLKLVGFSNWKVYGSFDLKELESKDQEMVWFVEK